MADNTTLNAASGGDVARSKDRSGVKTTIVGIDVGIGTGTEALLSTSNPLPVSDAGGSVTVDAPVSAPVFTTPTPSTSGGWSKWSTAKDNASNAPLSATVATVKGSAGVFGGYMIYNPNTSVAYVQVFDATSPTLGTTKADVLLSIPPQSAANIELVHGIAMANAIKVASTTTATGNTAPSTGLDCTFWFK